MRLFLCFSRLIRSIGLIKAAAWPFGNATLSKFSNFKFVGPHSNAVGSKGMFDVSTIVHMPKATWGIEAKRNSRNSAAAISMQNQTLISNVYFFVFRYRCKEWLGRRKNEQVVSLHSPLNPQDRICKITKNWRYFYSVTGRKWHRFFYFRHLVKCSEQGWRGGGLRAIWATKGHFFRIITEKIPRNKCEWNRTIYSEEVVLLEMAQQITILCERNGVSWKE